MWLTLPDPEMADQNLNKAGSLAKNEPAYLLIGRLQRSHGIKGELAMRVDTDFPERIRPVETSILAMTSRKRSCFRALERQSDAYPFQRDR